MKKKLMAIFLCTAMTATLFTACGGKQEASVESGSQEQVAEPAAPAAEPSEEPKPQVTSEAIPTPKYYFSFDEADGTNGITPTGQDKTGDPILFPVDKDVVFIPGVKGEAAYIDGTYGLKLDVNGVGDTYSVSYWMYATRFANYMPTVQFGPDVHGDATGGQHYLNITRTEWPGDPTFPCVWSYDQNNDGLWPAWSPDETGERLKEWINITLVVDPSRMSDDGLYIVPDLYINGDLYQGAAQINIVTGTMSPSDNFDFLLGVNYWDAIFKGAFDEVYVFDTALTAGQAKALYEAGDPNVAFEAPERVVVVTADENALESIGSMELNNGWWTDWTSSYEIPDGATKVFKLNNFSSGAELWHNYVMVFTNEATEAHKDPNTGDSHKEWAAVRADAFGWTPDGDIPGDSFNWSWGNWDTWKNQAMVDADVTVTVKRDGDTLDITADNVDYNGTSNLMKATVKTAMTADDPCYMLFTCEGSYVELMSAEDGIEVKTDPNAIATLGSTTFANGWWSDWTEATELKDGDSKNLVFTNYSDGVNNWDNYVFMFTNEYSAAGQDPNTVSDSHVEWAAVRADAYGWDDNYTPTYETSWGDDWATWLDAMKAATVTMTITRNGGEIVMDAQILDRKGNTLTNKTTFTSNLTADDPCYFLITCEECYIELLSME